MANDRTIFIGFRLNPDEHAKLKRLLKESGMTFQAFMVMIINQGISVRQELVMNSLQAETSGSDQYAQDPLRIGE